MNNVRLEATLLRLSLQNVSGKRQPVVYDNDTRARIFRAVRPSPKQNEHQWAFRETFPRPAPACLTPPRQARGPSLRPEDAPDWDYFVQHSYADLTGGF